MPPLLPSDLPKNNYFAEGHPKAKRVLKDDFFWEPGDDLSPIGGDGGSDTIAEFWDWRCENPNGSVYDFLQKWLAEIGFSKNDVNLFQQDDFTLAIGQNHLSVNPYDEYVIAVAFSQFMKDGYVDDLVYSAAQISLNRQTNTEVIQYRYANPSEATQQLEKVRNAFSMMERM